MVMDDEDNTPLHEAAVYGHVEIMGILTAVGAPAGTRNKVLFLTFIELCICGW